MAVSTVTPLPKSQPDMSKLNGFSGYMVSVTKHLQPRGTVGSVVIPTQKMSKEQLLQLQVHLPLQYRAGFYHFTVADEGGTGEDTWMVKLGTDAVQEESFMAGPGSNGTTPPNGFAGAPNVPMDNTAVVQILPGWYHNQQMGLLYTPWRATVAWNPGDELPKPPAQQPHPALTLVPPNPNASPWGQQPGGWGGYPVNESSSKEIEALKAQITAQAREREIADMRADQRRQQDETNKRIDDQARLTREMFEKLADVLTKTPKGPSDELLAIKAQNEKLERQLEQDRRDAQTREQASQMREEMRRSKEDTDRMIATITANKSDPMLTMMMQMMSQSNTGAMEAVKAIQASTSTANTSAERQVAALVEQMRGTIISPMVLMEMMRSSRGDGAEMSKMVLETTKEMNTLQRNVFEQLLDASSGGNQPAWLQAVQALADKVGPIGEALAARASQPRTVIQRVAVPVDAVGRPIQAGAMAGAPVQPQVAAQPAQAAQSTPVAAEVVSKRGRKKKSKNEPNLKPPTLAELREMDPDQLAKDLAEIGDEDFFGETLLGYVVLLRENVGKGMLAEQVAGTLWDRRQQLLSLTPMPPAVELLMAEQISVLIERVLPDAADAFHESVVDGIEERIKVEAEGAEA